MKRVAPALLVLWALGVHAGDEPFARALEPIRVTDRVVGDILFAGRIPFVGEADSRRWLERIDALMRLDPRVMITGHGEVSRDPARDLALTRDCLAFLRDAMGKAVEGFIPFDEAYAKTDWSPFSRLPAFEAANRVNAYGTYLLMEKELLAR
jgi:hypothetical protein